jgi:hypothetical protein
LNIARKNPVKILSLKNIFIGIALSITSDKHHKIMLK